MIQKYLGKISNVSFGIGGYNNAQLGLSLSFSCTNVGTSTFIGTWDYGFIEKPDENAKWSEEDRTEIMIDTLRKLSDTLHKAKVSRVDQLKGIPVEVTFEGNLLKDWRILEEVL